MKYIIFLLIFFSSVAFAGSGSSKPEAEKIITIDDTSSSSKGGTTFILNNYLKNEGHQSQESSINISMAQYATQLVETIKNIDPKKHYDNFTAMLERNKVKIGFGAAAALYVTTSAFLIRENIFLQQKKGWSSWRYELTNDELLELPQVQLAEMLLKNVQARYLNRHNPTDFVLPLVRFVQNMEDEEKVLTRYVTITSWLQRLKILWLFPTNQNLMKKARQRLKRLRILNHVFLSWTSEYNVIMALQGTAKRTIGKHINRLQLSPQLRLQHT